MFVIVVYIWEVILVLRNLYNIKIFLRLRLLKICVII